MNTHIDIPADMSVHMSINMGVHALAVMQYANNITEWVNTGDIEELIDPLLTIENNSLYLRRSVIATIDVKNRIMYLNDPHYVKNITKVIRDVSAGEGYSVANIIGVCDDTAIDVTDMLVIAELFLNRLIDIKQRLHDCYFLDERFIDEYVKHRQLHDSINKLPISIRDLFPTLKDAMESWVIEMTDNASSFITRGAEPNINLSAYRIDHNGVVERANADADNLLLQRDELMRIVRLSGLANKKGKPITISDSTFSIDKYGNVKDGEYGFIPYAFIQLTGLRGE